MEHMDRHLGGVSLCVYVHELALRLKRRGVSVLLSNSSAPFVQNLYAGKFRVESVEATRLVNSRASGRGPIPELILR
jgi:DNA adenine methylase